MRKYFNKAYLKKGIGLLKSKGFFSIFGSTFLVKFISFSSVLFLPRIIVDTDQYGILSIVDNFNSYLILISGLGLSNSILRFCALREESSEKRAVFEFCLKWGLIINGVFLIIAVVAISIIDFDIEGLAPYLIFGIGIPTFTYGYDCISLYLRADLKNKEYARLSIIYTACFAGLQILFAIGFKIYGALFGRYIALIAVLVVGVMFIKKKTSFFDLKPATLTKSEKKELIYFAIGGLAANAFSIIMPMNEQMVVTALLSDETQVAFYKVASIGPTNLQFIANAIVIFIYPYFVKRSEDFKWVKNKMLLTLGGIAAVIVPIMAVMFIFAPQLISIIFGSQYLPATNLMRVMCVTFAINSILRMPVGSILGAMGHVKFNAVNAGVTAGVHFLLDLYFISKYGIAGAAIALTLAYLGAGLVNFIYVFILARKHKGA